MMTRWEYCGGPQVLDPDYCRAFGHYKQRGSRLVRMFRPTGVRVAVPPPGV